MKKIIFSLLFSLVAFACFSQAPDPTAGTNIIKAPCPNGTLSCNDFDTCIFIDTNVFDAGSLGTGHITCLIFSDTTKCDTSYTQVIEYIGSKDTLYSSTGQILYYFDYVDIQTDTGLLHVKNVYDGNGNLFSSDTVCVPNKLVDTIVVNDMTGAQLACPIVFPLTMSDAIVVNSQAELDNWVNANYTGYVFDVSICRYVNNNAECCEDDICTGEWIDVAQDYHCRTGNLQTLAANNIEIYSDIITFDFPNGDQIVYDYSGDATFTENDVNLSISSGILCLQFKSSRISKDANGCVIAERIQWISADHDPSTGPSTITDNGNYIRFWNTAWNISGNTLMPTIEDNLVIGYIWNANDGNFNNDLCINIIGTDFIAWRPIVQFFTRVKKQKLASCDGTEIFRYLDENGNEIPEGQITCEPLPTDPKLN